MKKMLKIGLKEQLGIRDFLYQLYFSRFFNEKDLILSYIYIHDTMFKMKTKLSDS